MVTVSLDDPHEVVVIVQTNVLAPTDRPVTPEVGKPGVVTLAVPAITVHPPVPELGELPASVKIVPQSARSGPATAWVGGMQVSPMAKSLKEVTPTACVLVEVLLP